MLRFDLKMILSKGTLRKRFSIFLLIAAIISFFIHVNGVVISIRLNELREYLQNIDRNEGGIDHISLIATYEVHKKLYEKRITQDDADAINSGIDSLLMNRTAGEKFNQPHTALLTKPALLLINMNRYFLGKPPVIYSLDDDPVFRELDSAYYYERNFLFKKAIEGYNRALSAGNMKPQLKASVLLRQGYCYALTGLNKKAMDNYRKILSDYSQENSAITAVILIKYLEGFTAARDKVLLEKYDPLVKSQRLVNLLAYEHALDIITGLENKSGKADLPKIRYYKARCYSGLGQPEKAVETYLDLITSNPDSQYAKLSNRRLYRIGKMAGGNNSIVEVSMNLNSRLNDPVFNKIVDVTDEDIQSSEVPGKLDLKVPVRMMERVRKLSSSGSESSVKVLVIVTRDGNTFRGELIEENSDSVSINTSIGRVDVKRNMIKSVTSVK